MPFFSFSISDDPGTPDLATGIVKAADVGEALVLLNDVRANVYDLPDDYEWPVEASSARVWVNQV